MTTLATLQSLIAQGESEALEFKRSTAELRRAGETLCAFLNGEGGHVLIGVAPDGKVVGQQVAGAFHRTGAVEVWGRGTNRVIEACLAHGIAPPEFTDEAGVVTVTFKVAVVPDSAARHQVGTK